MRATSDLPTAVGPVRQRIGRVGSAGEGAAEGGVGMALPVSTRQSGPGLRPRQLEKEQGPRQENDQAHQLGRGEEASAGIIAAEYFHERTEHGLGKKISGENLSIESLATIQPGQAKIEAQAQEGIIDLSGM